MLILKKKKKKVITLELPLTMLGSIVSNNRHKSGNVMVKSAVANDQS